MRFGFTTGSCAAAASKAAAYMLLTGNEKKSITITTPKGIDFNAEIIDIVREEKKVICAVVKDGGDDPDITTGMKVFSCVKFSETCGIKISGGKGVGTVTKTGLDQKPGNAAINSVPRKMIADEVMEICRLCDYSGGIEIEISVPGGEKIAESTFNPRLGIEGGISILGTSGIVEPMSTQAILDTIKVELKQKKALAHSSVSVTPGNYGLDFMKRAFDFDLDKSVKCSNFIGETIDTVSVIGFEEMLLTGHIGKLVKVSGGIMNTHSKEGDCRMELMASAAIRAGCSSQAALKILESISTEEGIRVLKNEGEEKFRSTMNYLSERIKFFLDKRGGGKIKIEFMVYCNEFGLLFKSDGAVPLLEKIKSETKREEK